MQPEFDPAKYDLTARAAVCLIAYGIPDEQGTNLFIKRELVRVFGTELGTNLSQYFKTKFSPADAGNKFVEAATRIYGMHDECLSELELNAALKKLDSTKKLSIAAFKGEISSVGTSNTSRRAEIPSAHWCHPYDRNEPEIIDISERNGTITNWRNICFSSKEIENWLSSSDENSETSRLTPEPNDPPQAKVLRDEFVKMYAERVAMIRKNTGKPPTRASDENWATQHGFTRARIREMRSAILTPDEKIGGAPTGRRPTDKN